MGTLPIIARSAIVGTLPIIARKQLWGCAKCNYGDAADNCAKVPSRRECNNADAAVKRA